MRRITLLPWVYFLGLTGLVVWPWFATNGFLFLLDFVWTPILAKPLLPWQAGYLSFPWEWLWWGLSAWLPTTLLQKVFLTLPLLLSGVAMYHLVFWLGQRFATTRHSVITFAAIAAGTFYAFNPFVFIRIIMGHVYLLLAYGFTPWAVLHFLRAMDKPTVGQGIKAGLAIVTVMLANAHHLMLMPLLLIFFSKRPRRQNMTTWLTLMAMPTLVAGSTLILYRVAPTEATQLNPIGSWARSLQAPYSGNLILDALTLTATWKTDLPFLWPYEILSGFGLVSALLLSVMTLGIIWLTKNIATRHLAARLLGLLVVSMALAIGVAHPVTAEPAAWLYRYVPGWIALRDSAKFLSLLALAEAVCLGLGVLALAAATQRFITTRRSWLILPWQGEREGFCPSTTSGTGHPEPDVVLGGSYTPTQNPLRQLAESPLLGGHKRASLTRERLHSHAAWITSLAVCLLVIYAASPALFGLSQQVFSLPYPPSWYELNEKFAAEPTPPRVLFLPWNMYLPFSFTVDRTVANPAANFFTKAEIIYGDNSQVGGTAGRPFIYSESKRPLSFFIQQIMADAPATNDFGVQLARSCISYVLLATDTPEASRYDWLFKQSDMELIFTRDDLLLWRNQASQPPSCLATEVVSIE